MARPTDPRYAAKVAMTRKGPAVPSDIPAYPATPGIPPPALVVADPPAAFAPIVPGVAPALLQPETAPSAVLPAQPMPVNDHGANMIAESGPAKYVNPVPAKRRSSDYLA